MYVYVDTLENLQNAQQITVQLRRHVQVTEAGKIKHQLNKLKAKVSCSLTHVYLPRDYHYVCCRMWRWLDSTE